MTFSFQGVCTEAGMYALRERRVHVTQEDFELAVAKVTLVTSVLCVTVVVEMLHNVCTGDLVIPPHPPTPLPPLGHI